MFARWDKMAKNFTRIGKEIAIAVKASGSDPNPMQPCAAVFKMPVVWVCLKTGWKLPLKEQWVRRW